MSMIQNTEDKQPSDFLAMPFIGALNGFSDLSYSISESKSKFKRFKDFFVHIMLAFLKIILNCHD